MNMPLSNINIFSRILNVYYPRPCPFANCGSNARLVDDDSVGKTDDCIASQLFDTPLASRDHHLSIHNAPDAERVN